MNKMPILDGLTEYINEGVTPFHMPGHKNNGREFKELEFIGEKLYEIDNTEVPGLDNLHMPEGMILEAEKMAARAYKSGKSFFLVNGSTSGIYSMIMGFTKPGDKIIVQRNCHRSVFMACLMGGLETAYITPWILEGFNIAASVRIEDVIGLMDENMDARAVVLTYPTYYGTCVDLERIAEEAHKRGMLVLVDEAHGAHLYFNERLPKGAMECGADASVVSLHKTTPALTQTSLLNVREGLSCDGVRFMTRLFQSTSPSYVFMASIDAARYIMEERGRELLEGLLDSIMKFRGRMKLLPQFEVLGIEHAEKEGIFKIDPTKLVIRSHIGGTYLDRMLRNTYGIQVEMSDLNNVVALCSVGDSEEAFDRLYGALSDISKINAPVNSNKIEFKLPGYRKMLNMRDAYYKPKRKVRLKDAEGLVSAEIAAPYPPGIPLLLPGEIITAEIIEVLNICRDSGISISGLDDSGVEYINTAMI